LSVSTLTYVYGVTWASARRPDDLDVVEHGELAALTMPVDRRHLRAKRRDLLRHAEVVQRVFERAPVLPFQFGVVMDDVVDDLLEPRHDELAGLLRELDGLVELTVRATYREEDVLRTLLAELPQLARLRERGSPVQLGEGVARALAARREADAHVIVCTLQPLVRATAVDELRTEFDVFRGAFLVERRRVKRFDAEIERLARAHAATTSFKLTGPLPPHHFVRLAEGA
jgi:Gas vesicle synthesis protein GvpL/GvpF